MADTELPPPAEATGPARDRLPFLINRNYAKLWAGGAVSLLGDAVFDTTVVLWVATVLAKDKPWAPLAVSGVLLAMMLPMLLVAPLAGVFVDRWDYKRTMLVNDAIRAALIGGMVVLPLIPGGTLPVGVQLAIVYAAVLLSNVSAQFYNPARFGIVADVVAEDDQPQASSVTQATVALAGIAGPPLAAPLLFGFGMQWALAINALSFVVSFLTVRAVRVPAELAGAKPPAEKSGLWPEFVAGLRFFVGNRVLVAVVLSAMVVMVGAGSINVLDVFFLEENLNADPSYYGLLGMAFSAGSVVGALLGGVAARRLGLTRAYWIGLVFIALLFTAYARTTDLWVAVAVLAVGTIPIGALNSVIGPIVLRVTPREFVGRVVTVLHPAIQLASMVSVVVASWLASSALRDFDVTAGGIRFRTIDVIWTATGVLSLVAAIYARAALRTANLDRAPEPAPAADTTPDAAAATTPDPAAQPSRA